MYYSVDDPYVYPRSPVLQNLADIRELAALEVFEANAVLSRSIQLSFRSMKGSFDSAHLKAIHRYLFQDVYKWAGHFRTVNMGRSEEGIIFGHFGHIDSYLASVFQKLDREHCLRQLTKPAEFAERAAYYLGEINAVHPFREGNGRTQREFIRQLAEQAGLSVAWNRIERARLYAASEISFRTGDSGPLADLLLMALNANEG